GVMASRRERASAVSFLSHTACASSRAVTTAMATAAAFQYSGSEVKSVCAALHQSARYAAAARATTTPAAVAASRARAGVTRRPRATYQLAASTVTLTAAAAASVNSTTSARPT